MALTMSENEDWQYRGEGNCSLVVADPQGHKVYRLVKSYFTEKLDDLFALDLSTPKYELIQAELSKIVDYVRNVMQPLLSAKYVVPPVLTEIPESFATEAETVIVDSRPVHRKQKLTDSVDGTSRSALVLPDFCFIPQTRDSLNKEGEPTISIEIKPKKAFIPQSHFIDKSSSSRCQVCKFCMHQRLKAKEKQWPQTSHYCPLDLFSGNPQQMKHALLCLFKTPQNNLKICKNGEEVYGAGAKLDLGAILQDFFEDKNQKTTRNLHSFLDLVIKILLSTDTKGGSSVYGEKSLLRKSHRCQNGKFVHRNGDSNFASLPHGSVLERIFRVQALDDLDIRNIYPLYLKLQAHLKEHPENRGCWGLDGPYTRELWPASFDHLKEMNTDSLEYAVEKVKRFLLSKTVQDCSIMVAIQPTHKGSSDDHCVVTLNGQFYLCSVALIDLDPKPFDKIPSYYRQEMEIVQAYEETVEQV